MELWGFNEMRCGNGVAGANYLTTAEESWVSSLPLLWDFTSKMQKRDRWSQVTGLQQGSLDGDTSPKSPPSYRTKALLFSLSHPNSHLVYLFSPSPGCWFSLSLFSSVPNSTAHWSGSFPSLPCQVHLPTASPRGSISRATLPCSKTSSDFWWSIGQSPHPKGASLSAVHLSRSISSSPPFRLHHTQCPRHVTVPSLCPECLPPSHSEPFLQSAHLQLIFWTNLKLTSPWRCISGWSLPLPG